MKCRICLGVGGVVAILLELDAQASGFLQQYGEPAQFACPLWFQPHLLREMTPEIVDQVPGAPRAAVAAQQHLPAFIELVGLRLDLRQQRLQLLAGLVQIIGFFPLIRPDVAALAAQVLQHLHLHGHRQLEQRQQ